MKHLIVVDTLMVSTLSMAAQCEGLTKISEGGNYCTQHKGK
ncbi:MAG: hypothetical protein SOW92_02075 [Kiritimatiellia bacterium]|nr:hypothetical protein [Kiritimatiellia bacterium]